jgi:hypothetical protein
MTPTVAEVLERLAGWRQRMVTGGWWTALDGELYEAAGKMLAQRTASEELLESCLDVLADPKYPMLAEHRLRQAVEAAMGDRSSVDRTVARRLDGSPVEYGYSKHIGDGGECSFAEGGR